MRACLSLFLIAVLAASPALARGHYSRSHTQKLSRQRRYPKHGKNLAPLKHSAPKH